MKELIDQKTWEAMAHYGDAAMLEFYRRLKDRSLCSTQCKQCKVISFPPRNHCPECSHREVQWVELPTTGTLYAFTQQHRALRFGRPDVIGMVELEGVGHFVTRIDAPFDTLKIGQTVHLDFYEVSDQIVLHQFR